MTRSQALQREIEAVFRGHTGRECFFVPSARMGLYLVLRALFRPAERLLVSPLTDDIVLFVLLAAGVRPVAAPVLAADGNIDPDAVPEATWRSLRGVLTTNLYGLPDRVSELRRQCSERGLILVEDVAHALHSRVDGRPLGCFGDAGIFSLSKHAEGTGGVVAVAADGPLEGLLRLRELACTPRSRAQRTAERLRPMVTAALARIHLRTAARRALQAAGLAGRTGHRMPLRAPQLRRELRRRGMRHALRPEALGHAAVQAAVHAAVQAELPRWDRWIGFDLRDYRLEPHADALRKTLDWLHNRAQDEEARIAAVERLREFSAAAPAVRRGRATALFRVPLLVTDREAAGRELAAAGHPFEYVYDPPLDDYGGPEFVEPSTFPEPARWWGRHAVPVHPLLAAKLPDRVFAKSCFEPAGTSAPATARPATARLILP